MTVALAVLAVVLIVVGTVGTVVPGLPGVPLVLAGLVGLAWLDDFARVGPGTVALLVALAAASYVAEFGAAIGAQRAGASRWAIAGALAGTFFGLFLGLPGLLIGPFAGAIAGEWLARRLAWFSVHVVVPPPRVTRSLRSRVRAEGHSRRFGQRSAACISTHCDRRSSGSRACSAIRYDSPSRRRRMPTSMPP